MKVLTATGLRLIPAILCAVLSLLNPTTALHVAGVSAFICYIAAFLLASRGNDLIATLLVLAISIEAIHYGDGVLTESVLPSSVAAFAYILWLAGGIIFSLQGYKATEQQTN